MKKGKNKLEIFLNRDKAITLVSLVVTMIILIILAGISINMLLGENGILEVAKRAKENIERTQLEEQERLNELYKDLNYEEGEGSGGEISYDIIAKLNEFKKKIADYIEEAGGIKPEYTDSTETFGERIKGIVANVTKETNAEEMQILTGYKAYSKGKIRIGSMANQGAKTVTLNAGENYTIPEGYHNGQGKITAKNLSSQLPTISYHVNVYGSSGNWCGTSLVIPTGYTKLQVKSTYNENAVSVTINGKDTKVGTTYVTFNVAGVSTVDIRCNVIGSNGHGDIILKP